MGRIRLVSSCRPPKKKKQVGEMVGRDRNDLETCVTRKWSRRVIERCWWRGGRREGLINIQIMS
jgi:hypothetical protein